MASRFIPGFEQNREVFICYVIKNDSPEVSRGSRFKVRPRTLREPSPTIPLGNRIDLSSTDTHWLPLKIALGSGSALLLDPPFSWGGATRPSVMTLRLAIHSIIESDHWINALTQLILCKYPLGSFGATGFAARRS
jgi:hypothetical protein